MNDFEALRFMLRPELMWRFVESLHDSRPRLATMNRVAQTFQSAVSRVFKLRPPCRTDGPGDPNALAQTNALPTESRRYSRLKTCATTFRFRGSGPGADATGCHGYRGAHNGAVAFKRLVRSR